MQKSGEYGYVFLFGAIIFVILMLVLFQTTILQTSEDTQGGWQKLETQKDQVSANTVTEKTAQGNLTQEGHGEDSQSTAQGGGGDGSTAQSEADTTPEACSTRNAMYTIENSFKNETCIATDGESCIEKYIYCRATLKNEDIVAVPFTVSMIFVEDTKNKDTNGFGQKIESFVLEPDAQGLIEAQETITSEGQDGLANKVINCFANTVGTSQACV